MMAMAMDDESQSNAFLSEGNVFHVDSAPLRELNMAGVKNQRKQCFNKVNFMFIEEETVSNLLRAPYQTSNHSESSVSLSNNITCLRRAQSLLKFTKTNEMPYLVELMRLVSQLTAIIRIDRITTQIQRYECL